MKRLLLTGGTGFLGRHCLPLLLQRGFEVHATFRTEPILTEASIHWHKIDLLEAHSAKNLLLQVRPSHLLHLAWITQHGAYWTAPDNLHWVRASLELVESFADAGGQRLVMAGTCAEYDWRHDTCNERLTPLRPQTLYGACKHALHVMAEAFARQRHLSAAWARFFFLYGPYEHPQRLVPSVIRSLLAGESARCSHGRQVRDFLYVEDAAAALVALLDGELQGPVNIASGLPVSLGDLVHKIGAIVGGVDRILLDAVSARPDDPERLIADVGRLHHELGWAPQFSLEEGLRTTVNWWNTASSPPYEGGAGGG